MLKSLILRSWTCTLVFALFFSVLSHLSQEQCLLAHSLLCPFISSFLPWFLHLAQYLTLTVSSPFRRCSFILPIDIHRQVQVQATYRKAHPCIVEGVVEWRPRRPPAALDSCRFTIPRKLASPQQSCLIAHLCPLPPSRPHLTIL